MIIIIIINHHHYHYCCYYEAADAEARPSAKPTGETADPGPSGRRPVSLDPSSDTPGVSN